MTRTHRKIAVLASIATALVCIVAFSVKASAWVDGNLCKIWSVGGHRLEICANIVYGTQPDGDGINAEVIELYVIHGCSLLENDYTLTRMHAYTSYDKFPHLPYRDTAVRRATGCFPVRTINLYGPDHGATRFQFNAHIRIDHWPDKNPVWVRRLARP